jgi:RiboL-PSP-HEPN
MSPRANFRRTMKRVEALLHLNRTLQGRGRPPAEIHDLLRAAVVLALGALDALVADLIADAVPAAAKAGNIGDRVEGWVRERPRDFVSLLSHRDPHRALADLVRSRMANMTLQRAAAIEETLSSVLKLSVSWEAAAKKLDTNTTAEQVKQRLDAFVARRNQIAHTGDAQTGRAALASISRDWVEAGVRNVAAIGEAVCDVVARAYGPKLGRPRNKKS